VEGFVIAAIRALFTNEIRVTVSPLSVTLERDGRAVTLEPYLYYSRDGSTSKVVAVGQPPELGVSVDRVDVFDPRSNARAGLGVGAALATYFAAALKLVPTGLVAVRPRVRVRGVGSLRHGLGGDPDVLISTAIKAAGAHSCEVAL
jgi:hypothetical protein